MGARQARGASVTWCHGAAWTPHGSECSDPITSSLVRLSLLAVLLDTVNAILNSKWTCEPLFSLFFHLTGRVRRAYACVLPACARAPPRRASANSSRGLPSSSEVCLPPNAAVKRSSIPVLASALCTDASSCSSTPSPPSVFPFLSAFSLTSLKVYRHALCTHTSA